MPRFDAYTATVQDVRPEELVNLFWTRQDGMRGGKGFHRFEHRQAVVDPTGSEVGSVLYGGKAHGNRVMVEVKGERAPRFVEQLRQLAPSHRCTRVDSCEDFEEPGAWDRLLGHVLEVKRDHGLKGERRGDWDYPEDGRTQYLGAAQSAVRARLYEKGKQPEYRHLERFDLARLEIQVRPVKDAKTTYSSLDASQVWGASPFTRDLAGRVLRGDVAPAPAGTVWRKNSDDRKLAWMCHQYGGVLLALKGDLGDWQSVGLTIGEILADQLRKRRERGSA